MFRPLWFSFEMQVLGNLTNVKPFLYFKCPPIYWYACQDFMLIKLFLLMTLHEQYFIAFAYRYCTRSVLITGTTIVEQCRGVDQEQGTVVDACVLYWGHIKTRKLSIFLYFLPPKRVKKGSIQLVMHKKCRIASS